MSFDILVTGASGFVGWNLTRAMLEAGLRPRLTRHRSDHLFPELETLTLDLTDPAEVAAALEAAPPDVIVHCAANSQTGACERDRDGAIRANVRATENLSNALPVGGRFVHLSTDLVFGGHSAPYAETDRPHPINYYARTKLWSENRVREACPNHAIVRTTLVYGPSHPASPYASFLRWMHEGLGGEGLNLFVDEFRNPVYVGDLCQALIQLIDSTFVGALHIGGPERLSRHEFGQTFAGVHGYPLEKARRARLTGGQFDGYRPPDVTLDIKRARREFEFEPIDIRAGLERTATVERELL